MAKVGPFNITIGKPKKGLGLGNKLRNKKPVVVHPTIGAIVKDEIKNSVRSGLGKFGILGRVVAAKTLGPQSKFDPTRITPGSSLRSTTADGALKEHTKITVGLIGSIGVNAAKGFDALDTSITGAADRISASLDKLEKAMEFAAPPTKVEEAQSTPTQNVSKKKDDGGDPLSPFKKTLWDALKYAGSAVGAYALRFLKGIGAAEIGTVAVGGLALQQSTKGSEHMRDTRYEENVTKYGKEKADQLRAISDERITDPMYWLRKINPFARWDSDKPGNPSGADSKIDLNPVLGDGNALGRDIKELKYTFQKDISFKAGKIVFKKKNEDKGGDDKEEKSKGPSSSLNAASQKNAQTRYDDNVKQYGKEKADQLKALEDRPTSVGGLLSKLSPSNWFGGGPAQAKPQGGNPIPSDADMAAKDKAWMNGGKPQADTVPQAAKSKTGDYKEGSERISHAGGRLDGIRPELMSTMKAASKDLPDGYHAEIISGHDSRSTGTTNHPAGIATDIKIYDDQGKLVPHDHGGPGMKYYEQFHQSMVERGKVMYPNEKFIWGGTWQGAASGNGDPMHMQILDKNVPGSSKSSGAYNDDKGAPNHPFAPYLMNDKERSEYKDKVRDNIKNEPTSGQQGFIDSKMINEVTNDVAKNGLRQGGLSDRDWGNMTSSEKMTWQFNQKTMEQPEYQHGPNDATGWGEFPGFRKSEIDDRRAGSFDGATGDIKGFSDSSFDRFKMGIQKPSMNDLIGGNVLSKEAGLGDLPKGAAKNPSWGERDTQSLTGSLWAPNPKIPMGAREPSDSEHGDSLEDKRYGPGNMVPPTPFYDEKPNPTGGPQRDLSDLTPKNIIPQADASGFRKYEGNNSDPDKGKRRRDDDENSDKESGRRSFMEYTGNSYDEAG